MNYANIKKDVYKRQVIGRESNVYPLSSVRGCISSHSIYKKQGEVVEKQ